MIYVGTRSGVTTAATTDVMHLYAASGEYGRILEASVQGEATTSTAMRTRLARASTAGTTPTTNVDVNLRNPQQPAFPNKLDCVTTITSPSYTAGSLLPVLGWNAHGGFLFWRAGATEEEIVLIGAAAAAHISWRNEVGVATADFGLTWRE